MTNYVWACMKIPATRYNSDDLIMVVIKTIASGSKNHRVPFCSFNHMLLGSLTDIHLGNDG